MDHETEIELDDVDLIVTPGVRAFRLGLIKAHVEYSVNDEWDHNYKQYHWQVSGWTLKKVYDEGGEYPLTSGPLFDMINAALHATHEEVIIRHCEDVYAYERENA